MDYSKCYEQLIVWVKLSDPTMGNEAEVFKGPVYYEIKGSFLIVQEKFEVYKQTIYPMNRIKVVYCGGKYNG